MERGHYGDDHRAFAELARGFVRKEVAPHYLEWEAAGIVPRSVFARAGELGLLGFAVPQSYGGLGVSDFRFNQTLIEEFMAGDCAGVGLNFALHNDICTPYLVNLTTGEQRERWLPGFVAGSLIAAIGMTEPGAGSDVAGIRTAAVDMGDHFLVNGAKTFITNGINADLVRGRKDFGQRDFGYLKLPDSVRTTRTLLRSVSGSQFRSAVESGCTATRYRR